MKFPVIFLPLMFFIGCSTLPNPAIKPVTHTTILDTSPGTPATNTIKQMMEATVEIYHGSIGSGVALKRKDGIYILTAAHVVIDPKKWADFYAPTTMPIPKITVSKNMWDKSGTLHRAVTTAEVVTISRSDDICLLKLDNTTGFEFPDTKIYQGETPLPIGTEIFHVGNFKGDIYPDSVVTGIISHNRRTTHTTYQGNMSVFPGGSGGGVFLKNGEYIGFVSTVELQNMSISGIVSIDSIKKWAIANKVEKIIFQ